MARPTTARLQVAYDAGVEHGRTGSGGPPEFIANDPELLQAYDEGLRAGTDQLDTDTGGLPAPVRAAHRANPRPARAARTTGTTSTATASSPRTSTATRSARTRVRAGASTSNRRFSHPLWSMTGTGARGHTVGRPTLRPPARLNWMDGTGFLFGLVAYALVINYLRYGPHGVTSWLSAKFLNEPTMTNKAQAGVLGQLGKAAGGSVSGLGKAVGGGGGSTK